MIRKDQDKPEVVDGEALRLVTAGLLRLAVFFADTALTDGYNGV